MIRRLGPGGIGVFAAVNAVGISCLAWGLYKALWVDELYLSPLLGGLLVGAILVGMLSLRIAGLRSILSISDAIAYLAMLMLGPGAAIVVAATEAALGTLRHTRRVLSVSSSVAVISSSFALGCAGYVLVTDVVLHRSALAGSAREAIALGVLVAVHFLANSWQIALLTSVSRRLPLVETWVENYLWTAHSFVVAGIVAALVHALNREHGIAGVVVPAMLLCASYLTYRRYLKQLDDKNNRIVSMANTHAAALEALATAMDARGQSNVGHVRRVQAAASVLGELAGLDSAGLESIKIAALLHDVGRIGVPDHILNKPHSLTESEMAKVRTYPRVGARVLAGVGFPESVQQAIRQHRERWDGSGYPDGLKGKEISLPARILSLVDAADAMRAERNYRLPLDREEMIRVLREEAERQFDPELVELYLSNLGRIEAAADDLILPDWDDVVEISTNQREFASRFYQDQEVTVTLQEISAARQEATRLFEFVDELRGALGLDEAARITLENLSRVVSFDCGAIYLQGDKPAKLDLVGSMVKGQHRFPELLDCNLAIVDRALESKHVLTAITEPIDSPLRPDWAQHHRSSLFISLSSEGQKTGLVILLAAKEDAFSDDDHRVLAMVSRRIAKALENAASFDQVRQGAQTDALTGLPNMRSFHEQVECFLRDPAQVGETHGIVVLDLDRFKQLNDRCGHQAGDHALRSVAQYLRMQFREDDWVCRWGGDEFVAFLPCVSSDEVAAIVRRAQTSLDEVDLLPSTGPVVELGLSAGWALFPADGRSVVDLLRVADKRMYRDKSERQAAVRGASLV